MGKPLSLKCLQASWKETWRQAVSLGRGRHDGLGDEWHVVFLLASQLPQREICVYI